MFGFFQNIHNGIRNWECQHELNLQNKHLLCTAKSECVYLVFVFRHVNKAYVTPDYVSASFDFEKWKLLRFSRYNLPDNSVTLVLNFISCFACLSQDLKTNKHTFHHKA